MTPAQIIAMARSQSGMDSVSYPDTLAIDHLNYVYDDITSDIISKVDEDHFFEIATSDTVANQEEYVIDTIVKNTDSLSINEVNNVYIKYEADAVAGTKARRVNPTQLQYDPDWYKTNWNKLDPIFFIQDKSIFIYPAPDSSITGGLKITCIYQPKDLTTSSTEDEIEIAPRFHNVLVAGMLPYIFAYKQDYNVEQAKFSLYKIAKNDMIGQLKNRNQTTVQILPNDNNY